MELISYFLIIMKIMVLNCAFNINCSLEQHSDEPIEESPATETDTKPISPETDGDNIIDEPSVNPETGDNMMIWLYMLIASFIGAAICLAFGRVRR